MKILIIEQVKMKSIPSKPLEKTVLTMFSILPSLYPRRLAAITPTHHTVTVINERYHQIPSHEIFDIVLIHFNTASAYRAYHIADTFRQKNIPVVFCGLHASALPNEASQHADSILLGRGEGNWLQLLNDMEQTRLKKLYQPEPYGDLSCSIPPTHVTLPGFQITGAIEATRGCPYRCNFCPEANTPDGHLFYARPVEEIIEEIRSVPQKTLMFYDLSLTINKEFTKELFLKMRTLKKRFFCNGNVDALANDEELVRLSHEAGCIGWLVGFESFSQQTLASVGKKTNKVSDYGKAIDLIHKYKMAVIGDFMFGFDSDTLDVFETTVQMIKDLHIDVADFSILTPFPGTPIFQDLKKEKRILTEDWERYTMHSVVFQPKNMQPRDLINGVTALYNEFYSPKYTVQRICHAATLGIRPFFLILARNTIGLFSRKNLLSKKREEKIIV